MKEYAKSSFPSSQHLTLEQKRWHREEGKIRDFYLRGCTYMAAISNPFFKEKPQELWYNGKQNFGIKSLEFEV